MRIASTRRHARAGFTLMELAAAIALLLVAMTTTVEVLGWVAAEHREAGRRLRAASEASNSLELLSARPWDELTTEGVGAVRLSPEAARALPDGRLEAEVSEAGDGLKRLRVEVRWRGRHGPASPLRLTAWVARRGRAAR